MSHYYQHRKSMCGIFMCLIKMRNCDSPEAPVIDYLLEMINLFGKSSTNPLLITFARIFVTICIRIRCTTHRSRAPHFSIALCAEKFMDVLFRSKEVDWIAFEKELRCDITFNETLFKNYHKTLDEVRVVTKILELKNKNIAKNGLTGDYVSACAKLICQNDNLSLLLLSAALNITPMNYIHVFDTLVNLCSKIKLKMSQKVRDGLQL